MKRISKLLRRSVMILLLLPFSYLVHAQVEVSGKVSSLSEGETIPGVNIYEKGTSNGTITDINGSYTLTVSGSEAVLVFSSIGYSSQEIPVGEQSIIDIELADDIADLDEVVVVGYGGIKRKELTGAVTTVSSETILKSVSSDLNSALQGQMAGVSIQASSGAPGAQANIQIRGIGSFSAESVNPLYVIDGIPYDGIPSITPEEIETIDVSKDGATAAIYGTRASNGVIQITTKKGAGGKLKVSYTNYYGIQNITSGIELMGTEHHIFTDNIRGINNGANGTAIFLNTPTALERDNDFQEYIMVKDAPIMNHSLQLSGGSDDARLSMVTNYFKQDGVLKNSGYNSLSTRINGSLKKDRFQAFSSISLKLENREAAPWGIYEESVRKRPYEALPGDGFESTITDSNPTFYGSFAQKFSDRDRRKFSTVNANIDLQYEIIKGLTARVTVGGDVYNFRRKIWQPQYFILNGEGEVNPNASREDAELEQRYEYRQHWTVESNLTYKKSIQKHNFTLLAGYSREATDRFEEIARKSDFISNETQVFNAGNEMTGISGFIREYRIVGALGRVMYNYDERYLFTASVRNDASSNFAPSKKRKTFWGTSAGWNIAEEPFFAPLKEYIDQLKLRASIAELGNDRIRQYLYSTAIYPGSNYHFGAEGSETVVAGSTQRTYANEDIQWETNIKRNIGVDASFFNGRVGLTFDAYRDSKEDMLIPVELPPSAGTWIPRSENEYRTVIKNVGNMINQGIEFDVKYNGKVSDFVWSLQGVFMKNINEVTKLPPEVGSYSLGGGPPILYTSQPENVAFVVIGQPVPTFMLYETAGIIKTQKELDEYNAQFNEPTEAQLGDLRYVDANKDSVLNGYDRVASGSPNPNFEAALNFTGEYKGIDLAISLYYSHGAELYNGAKALAYQLARHEDLYYQWTPSNPDSDIPSLRNSGQHNNVSSLSDQYIEDGTYLRVRNITLGYSLPKKWIEKIKFDRVRAHISLQNPITFTKYTGFDPEVGYSHGENNGGTDALFSRGVDRGNYPVARRYVMGLTINF